VSSLFLCIAAWAWGCRLCAVGGDGAAAGGGGGAQGRGHGPRHGLTGCVFVCAQAAGQVTLQGIKREPESPVKAPPAKKARTLAASSGSAAGAAVKSKVRLWERQKTTC